MTMIEMTVVKQVNAKTLKVEAGVRYWEDGEVNGVSDEEGDLIPCRSGDAWCPLIDIDTGVIQGWPAGTTAKLHYKVADDGIYTLLGDDGEQLVQRDGYVPKIMSPGGSGYGDYIIMSIGPDGAIEGWNADLSHFEGRDDEQ